MRLFTFTDAARPVKVLKSGKISDTCKIKYCQPAYVICPNGSYIYEPYYNGNGIFGTNDIYELVSKWNRDYIADIIQWNVDNDKIQMNDDLFDVAKAYSTRDYPLLRKTLQDFMEKNQSVLAIDWLRTLGIYATACSENPYLKFPIKITSGLTSVPYDKLQISETCR